jgi:hypothetical protein
MARPFTAGPLSEAPAPCPSENRLKPKWVDFYGFPLVELVEHAAVNGDEGAFASFLNGFSASGAGFPG